jgi:hypothetical protein
MKILSITDIHGAYKTTEEIIRHESPDVLVIGGDLTNVGTVREVDQAIGKFQVLAKKILCVAGNMDLPQHDEFYSRIGVSINGRGVIIDNVGFFGVSAAPHSRLRTPYEISEEEIAQRIERGYADVQSAQWKIFVPHAPPYGTKVDIIHAGFHVGSMAVRDFVEEAQPHVVLCGHIHEARGQDKIENSHIVNCGPGKEGYYAIVKIDTDVTISLHKHS